MGNNRVRKKDKMAALKVSANVKLDVNGIIIDLEDILRLVQKPKEVTPRSPERKITPIVIRRYEYAVELKEKLEQLLEGVRELSSKYKCRINDDACIESNNVLYGTFQWFQSENEARLLRAIEAANINIEYTLKEYKKSIYYVATA